MKIPSCEATGHVCYTYGHLELSKNNCHLQKEVELWMMKSQEQDQPLKALVYYTEKLYFVDDWATVKPMCKSDFPQKSWWKF